MYAKIQPITVGLPPVSCDALRIANVTCNALGLDGQATIQWAVTGDAPGAYQGGSLSLDGAAYTAWGNNDDYLYTYTATALGLTIIEIVPDAPPAPPEPVITAPPVLPDGAPVVDDTAAPVAPSVADSEEPK
jgi:hypothetical protein